MLTRTPGPRDRLPSHAEPRHRRCPGARRARIESRHRDGPTSVDLPDGRWVESATGSTATRGVGRHRSIRGPSPRPRRGDRHQGSGRDERDDERSEARARPRPTAHTRRPSVRHARIHVGKGARLRTAASRARLLWSRCVVTSGGRGPWLIEPRRHLRLTSTQAADDGDRLGAPMRQHPGWCSRRIHGGVCGSSAGVSTTTCTRRNQPVS